MEMLSYGITSMSAVPTKVAKFKTNSHIIPRWAMSDIKTDGKFVAFDHHMIKVKQTDLRADIICEPCERMMTDDDSFGSQFFRGLENWFQDNGCSRIPAAELVDPNLEEQLLSFLGSIILRWHFYMKTVKNVDILGSELETFRKGYFERSLHKQRLFYFTYRLQDYIGANSSPAISQFAGHKALHLTVLGYHSIFFFDPSLKDSLFGKKSQDPFSILNTKGTRNVVGLTMESMMKSYENRLRSLEEPKKRTLFN